jgi:hypothetical protein
MSTFVVKNNLQSRYAKSIIAAFDVQMMIKVVQAENMRKNENMSE